MVWARARAATTIQFVLFEPGIAFVVWKKKEGCYHITHPRGVLFLREDSILLEKLAQLLQVVVVVLLDNTVSIVVVVDRVTGSHRSLEDCWAVSL